LDERLQGANRKILVLRPEPKARVQRGCEAKFFCNKGQEESTKCNKFLSFTKIVSYLLQKNCVERMRLRDLRRGSS